MTQFFNFLSQNSQWLFGGSSVAAILVGLVRHYAKKPAPSDQGTAPKPQQASNTTIAGRDIIYKNDLSLKGLQYTLVLAALMAGALLVSASWVGDDFSENNQITGGDGSTNIISTGGSNVSTD